MIVRVSGELVEKGAGYAVVLTGGVGYQLFVSDRHLMRLPEEGAPVDIHTRQIVRENEISLYGFATATERRLFDILLAVGGLGPRIALSLLGTIGEESVVAAILSGDAKVLVRAPGVGAKLAQRICVDLVDKVREEALLGRVASGAAPYSDDVVAALVALGHRRPDAEKAAIAAREEAGEADPQTLIPLALKYASK